MSGMCLAAAGRHGKRFPPPTEQDMIRTIAAALAAFALVSFGARAEEKKAEKKEEKSEKKAEKKEEKAEKKAEKHEEKHEKKAAAK